MARTAGIETRPLGLIPADDLVGTMTRVRPDVLHTFHRNARRGDVDAIAGSLRKHSQYRPVVVNYGTYTGRPFEVLAGNHTLMGIRQLSEVHPEDPRWNGVDVFWVDVDDPTCTSIVVADNRTAELGSMDNDGLKGLLDSLPSLDGTGFTEQDYQDLVDSLVVPPMPDLTADPEPDLPSTGAQGNQITLTVTADVRAMWEEHRADYDSDTTAMLALL